MADSLLPKVTKICKVEWCNKSHMAKGYCQRHYDQYRIFGAISRRLLSDPNEIVIKDSIAEIVLYNKQSQETARAIIDAEDLSRLNGYKWTLAKNKYVISKTFGKMVYLHRLIAKTPEGKITDHINCNRLDNRKANLRLATDTQNNQNKNSRRGSSKYKGVCFLKTKKWPLKKPWLSYITCNKKRKYLGYYATEEEAAHVYDKAAKELFGEFAKPNFTVTTSL